MKCLDTYILWEFVTGNKKYLQYFEKDFMIPEMILAEFYGVLLREFNEATAEYWLGKFRPYASPCGLGTLVHGIRFKRRHSKVNFSLFDVIGYTCALENNMLFVTGDKEFKNFPGVEFVPKNN